jgi:hypothetical protein
MKNENTLQQLKHLLNDIPDDIDTIEAFRDWYNRVSPLLKFDDKLSHDFELNVQ